MIFLNFYKIWFHTISLELIKLIFASINNIYKFIKFFYLEFWILIIISLILLIIVFVPWFSYSLELEEVQHIHLRTKKWYLLMLPSLTTLFFLWIYHKILYYIQLAINFMAIAMSIYGLFDQSFHISLKGDYHNNGFIYVYPVILIIHSYFIKVLKYKKNFIFFQIIKQLRIWKKNNNLN